MYTQSQFASWCWLGTPDCVLVSRVVLEATYQARLRALEGCYISSKKHLMSQRPRWIKLLERTEEKKVCLSNEGSLICQSMLFSPICLLPACPPLNLIDCDLPAYQLGKGANKQEEQPNCFGRHGIGRFVVSRMKSNNYYYFLFPILKDILVPTMTKTEYSSVQNKKGKKGKHIYKHFHLHVLLLKTENC